MRIREILLLILLGSAVAGTTSGAHPPQDRKTDLTVSAAISLKDALARVTPLFARSHPEVVIHYNLGASGTLQLQIEQGAPVDVYISASPDQMDVLAQRNLLLSDTRQDLLRNTVVLIVPRNSTGISNFADLRSRDVKVVAVGEPQTVPAGKYARQVLTHLGLYETLRPKFVFAKDVRQVLTYVASGDADAGIVYATDAKSTSQVRVVATASEDSHAPVIYPVAVLKDSKDISAAEKFVVFLCSPSAQAVFEKFGFSPAK